MFMQSILTLKSISGKIYQISNDFTTHNKSIFTATSAHIQHLHIFTFNLQQFKYFFSSGCSMCAVKMLTVFLYHFAINTIFAYVLWALCAAGNMKYLTSQSHHVFWVWHTCREGSRGKQAVPTPPKLLELSASNSWVGRSYNTGW